MERSNGSSARTIEALCLLARHNDNEIICDAIQWLLDQLRCGGMCFSGLPFHLTSSSKAHMIPKVKKGLLALSRLWISKCCPTAFPKACLHPLISIFYAIHMCNQISTDKLVNILLDEAMHSARYCKLPVEHGQEIHQAVHMQLLINELEAAVAVQSDDECRNLCLLLLNQLVNNASTMVLSRQSILSDMLCSLIDILVSCLISTHQDELFEALCALLPSELAAAPSPSSADNWNAIAVALCIIDTVLQHDWNSFDLLEQWLKAALPRMSGRSFFQLLGILQRHRARSEPQHALQLNLLIKCVLQQAVDQNELVGRIARKAEQSPVEPLFCTMLVPLQVVVQLKEDNLMIKAASIAERLVHSTVEEQWLAHDMIGSLTRCTLSLETGTGLKAAELSYLNLDPAKHANKRSKIKETTTEEIVLNPRQIGLWWQCSSRVQDDFSGHCRRTKGLSNEQLHRLCLERVLCLSVLTNLIPEQQTGVLAFLDAARLLNQCSIARWLLRALSTASSPALHASIQAMEKMLQSNLFKVHWQVWIAAADRVMANGTPATLPTMLGYNTGLAVVAELIQRLVTLGQVASSREGQLQMPSAAEIAALRTLVVQLMSCIPVLSTFLQDTRSSSSSISSSNVLLGDGDLQNSCQELSLDVDSLLGPGLEKSACKLLLAVLLVLLRQLLHVPKLCTLLGISLTLLANAAAPSNIVAMASRAQPLEKEKDEVAAHVLFASLQQCVQSLQDGSLALLLLSTLHALCIQHPVLLTRLRGLLWYANRAIWTEHLELQPLLSSSKAHGLHPLHPLLLEMLTMLLPSSLPLEQTLGCKESISLFQVCCASGGQEPEELLRRLWLGYWTLECWPHRLAASALYLKDLFNCHLSATASSKKLVSPKGPRSPQRSVELQQAFPGYTREHVVLYVHLALCPLPVLLLQVQPCAEAAAEGPYEAFYSVCMLLIWALRQLVAKSSLNRLCKIHEQQMLKLVSKLLLALAEAVDCKTAELAHWRSCQGLVLSSIKESVDAGAVEPFGRMLHWAGALILAIESAAQRAFLLLHELLPACSQHEKWLRHVEQRTQSSSTSLQRLANAHSLELDPWETVTVFQMHDNETLSEVVMEGVRCHLLIQLNSLDLAPVTPSPR